MLGCTPLGRNVKYLWIPIGIAGWTILQTVAHAWWILYGQALLACSVKVTKQLEFYLYLTYFYSNGCDNNAISDYATINFNLNTSAASSIFDVPAFYESDGTMTASLMDLYLACDAIWIVTAVSLLIGVVMRLKEGSALIFYMPWILVAVVTLALDFLCSMYFGLLLPTADIIQTPLPWKLHKTTIMAIVSGRLGLIWIINLSNVLYISWFTRGSFKQRYADEKKRGRHHYHGRRPKIPRQDTEDRIKNWQLFYGDTGDESANLDYTHTFKELEEYNRRRTLSSSISTPGMELCSTFKSASTINGDATEIFTVSSGVFEDEVEGHQNITKKRVQIQELDNHLPWSYIKGRKENGVDLKMATN